MTLHFDELSVLSLSKEAVALYPGLKAGAWCRRMVGNLAVRDEERRNVGVESFDILNSFFPDDAQGRWKKH